jgi:hypothetical protein
MSQNYNFKSLQYSEDNKEQKTNPDKITVFETGETKTIDFIQKDGTRQSFPYAHYMTAWMGTEDDERFIKIFFATHLVTIKGYCLDQLYDHLTQFKLTRVIENDERYLKDLGDDEVFISTIEVEWKGGKDS